jgi:hypothetical protein
MRDVIVLYSQKFINKWTQNYSVESACLENRIKLPQQFKFLIRLLYKYNYICMNDFQCLITQLKEDR